MKTLTVKQVIVLMESYDFYSSAAMRPDQNALHVYMKRTDAKHQKSFDSIVEDRGKIQIY